MYRSKSSDRNCYRIFSEEMDAAVQRRNLIETKLREALRDGTGISLHYQPQLHTSGALVAVEGLMRWHDADLGDLAPSEVIPIAEESGLIARLGEATFRMACKAAADWPHLLVAVNLSPLQFREDGLPARLRAITREEGIECDQIEIEITEGLLIEHADVSEAAIRELRESGFRIALDDFGTGYSSLSYLRRFPVDKIKLDRSFIQSANLGHSSSIIRAAVTLGHALNLTVVAEGISSSDQEKIALEAGCDALQGHLYAPAMPADSIRNFKPLCPAPFRTAAA
jgi:EAL domain-containing protein (putative c-di-GMP-specific phosphodiesterase class I)